MFHFIFSAKLDKIHKKRLPLHQKNEKIMATFWTKRNEDIEDEKTAMPWGELFVKGDRNIPRRRRLKVALFDLDGVLLPFGGG